MIQDYGFKIQDFPFAINNEQLAMNNFPKMQSYVKHILGKLFIANCSLLIAIGDILNLESIILNHFSFLNHFEFIIKKKA